MVQPFRVSGFGFRVSGFGLRVTEVVQSSRSWVGAFNPSVSCCRGSASCLRTPPPKKKIFLVRVLQGLFFKVFGGVLKQIVGLRVEASALGFRVLVSS